MLTPAQIRAQAERKYWDVLKSLVTGDNCFPLIVRFGQPSPSDEFAKLKQETEALVAGNFGYTVEYENKETRKWGTQSLPCQVRFDTAEQFFAALGKTREVEAFKRNIAEAIARLPGVSSWLVSYVKAVVENANDWEGILRVCEYFLKHPRPGLYIRQLPIAVHTKFIQEHAQVLTSLLLAILPDESKTKEGRSFENKFGLRPVEHAIRFRTLDESVTQRLGLSHPDMALPLDVFRALSAQGLRIIITENLMNFECLPKVPNGLGIWGQGRAAELLFGIDWLTHDEVLYWGDIDEHGFGILAGLRSHYPNVRSLMMNGSTLEQFLGLCGPGEKAGKAPNNLTPEERQAFDRIASNNLRLEQEKIPPAHSEAEIRVSFQLV